jgi:hypothetical protein
MSFTNFTTGKSHSFGGQYLEAWFVEAETTEEARKLLLSGAGHRCGIGECIHAELEQIAE